MVELNLTFENEEEVRNLKRFLTITLKQWDLLENYKSVSERLLKQLEEYERQ